MRGQLPLGSSGRMTAVFCSLRKGSASDGANQSAADDLDDVGQSTRSRGEALRENHDLDVVAHERPEVDEPADPRVDAEVRDGHGRTGVGHEVLLAPFAEARRERGIRSQQADVDRAIGAVRLVDAQVARWRLIAARLPAGAEDRESGCLRHLLDGQGIAGVVRDRALLKQPQPQESSGA